MSWAVLCRLFFATITAVQKAWGAADEDGTSALLAMEWRWEPIFQRLAVVWLRKDLLQPY